MRHVAIEGEGIARPQGEGLAAVAIADFPFEDVDELDAFMLEGGKHLAGVGECHQKRLEGLLRPAM